MNMLSMRNTRVIRLIQHILAAVVALLIVLTTTGSGIIISGVKGESSYNLYESDKNKPYEESYFFNDLLGNSLSDIIKLAAEKSQFETRGCYDSEKSVDVTAFENRNAFLSGDYITAIYRVSDLLKWSEDGFVYEKRSFTDDESKEYLNDSTIYTHLKTDFSSAGMNSYLCSQIENNSVELAINPKSYSGGGEHSVLLQKYHTVTGKNIENLVSDWTEYNLLCTYVEETSKDISKMYEDYRELSQYYSFDNSNLRFYISRTLNGKSESFTNIEELKTETAGVDIKSLFEGYGKYIYYCPCEHIYETNTLLKEENVKDMLADYKYVFPEQIRMYIAVDTATFPVQDAFVQGKKGFSKYMPYKRQLIILIAIAALLYFFALYNNLRYIPKEERGEGRHTVFTEVIVLWGSIIMAIPPVILLVYSDVFNMSASIITKYSSFPAIAFGMGFVIDIGFLFIVYSLAAKVKSGCLWKDSFLSYLVNGTKNLIIMTIDNGNVIIRTWVPYVTFVLLNILLINLGISGIALAVCLDILIGIYIYRQNLDRTEIIHIIENIQNGDVKAKVNVYKLNSDNINLAKAVNSIGEGINEAINTSMKDEKLKADLITNVSHDIKTPLTSIINYVDLIKREDIENAKVKEYLDVLEVKSQKLKQLTEDLVEISKITSGNINISLSRIDFVELINQTLGEFYEKLEKAGLQAIFRHKEQRMEIMADPRHLWRVLENLINNVCKYALTGTRVYMSLGYYTDDESNKKQVLFFLKNVSEAELNVDETEITERFIRGDVSRTTEGSGLGLSIAKNLTTAQGGSFEIRMDGDLFTVILGFDALEDSNEAYKEVGE